MFNALVRKDDSFNYVGELAREINTSPDGMTVTFMLRDGVRFHNGKDFTSADVKYTFDELFKANGFKAKAFFDTVPVAKADATASNSNPFEEPKTKSVPHILSLTTPDAKTVVFVVGRPSLRNQLLSNLVAIPIIPEGTIAQQKEKPIGSGPFKFISFDQSQNIIDLEANGEYWDGAPKFPKLRLKTITEAASLQAELHTGSVDIAPNPTNLPPDIIKAMKGTGKLNVEQFDGSNIQYLVFNAQSGPLANIKVRQAIGYAVDRNKIVAELLSGQAKVANSVLPSESWAYSPGTEYKFDPAKAKQLLQEAGYKNEPINFKFRAGSAAVNQYAQAIQSSLNEVGLNVQIETLDGPTILQQLAQGQFQMYTGIWVGGNQDPIFLRDLFHSAKIPGGSVSCCNRSRYSSDQVDRALEEAVNATDPQAAKAGYVLAWNLISFDLPLFPLWYPANVVVSNKRVGNIKMSGSGDWTFLKDITVSN